MTAGPAPDATRRNLGDRVAPWVLVLAPFLSFLHLHGRSPFALDSLLIVAVFVLVGSVAGLGLSALRGTVLYLLAMVGLLLVAVDLQFAADGHFRVIGLVVLAVVWIFREHIASLASIVVAVLAILTLLTGPQDSVERAGTPVSERSSVNVGASGEELPAVVHLVLDEHAGLGGLPKSPAGAAARADIERRYRDAGFTVYPRAFSEYSLTANSLPNAFNFDTNDQHLGLIGGEGTPFPAQLPSNAYFARMVERGYALHVYQPAFLDLCGSRGVPVSSCTTVPGNSLLTLDAIGLPAVSRAGLVFRYWLANESYLYDKVRGIGARLGLPPHPAANARVGTGGALELMDQLESNILDAQETSGQMYFAHLLIPHSPFFFDADCVPTSRPLAPDTGAPEAVETAYLEQVQCVSRMVTDFLDRAASALGDRAIVIVHGDHGARILPRPVRNAAGEFDPTDLADRYSAFFAVRTPDRQAASDERLVSIRELIDQGSTTGFDPEQVEPGEAFLFLDFTRGGGSLERYSVPSGWLERSQ